jgi:hypothetical protein
MDKIYLWIGLTNKTEEEYWNYFYQKGEKPQFCFDAGLEYLMETHQCSIQPESYAKLRLRFIKNV